MKVILVQDVDKLGKAGTVKEVKTGYGFNFLLPQGLAELATPGTIKRAEQMLAKQAEEKADQTRELKTRATALNDRKVIVESKAEDDKLFGSVGKEEIVKALVAVGIDIEAGMIILDKPIKKLGTFSVSADFGHDIKAIFEVIVKAA